MGLPTPVEADAATMRVRMVADMLLQKAQEVQSKGNAGAAQSLHDSAQDLQRAAALLHELTRHVHSLAVLPHHVRRDSDASVASLSSLASLALSSGPPSQDGSRAPPASASVKDLVTRLARVDTMLGKKSDEMKQKGNEGAGHALHQSALAVRLGAQHIAEQQHMTRTLVVTARALREQLREQIRLVLVEEDITDETPLDEELTQRAVARVKELVALGDVVRSVCAAGTGPDELRAVLLAAPPVDDAAVQAAHEENEAIDRLTEECAFLQEHLHDVQLKHERELRAAHDATANMTTQCGALEKALEELEAEYHERRERELEHLNALHERQKETHEELKKLLFAKEEEVGALKIQAESWMNQLTKQQQSVAELQEQREHDRLFYDRQATDLREQVHARDVEMRELKQEIDILQQQIEDLHALSEHGGDDDAIIAQLELQREVDELSQQLLGVRAQREHALAAVEEAELHVDTIRSEMNARLEQTDKAAQAALASISERDARIAALDAELAAAHTRLENGPAEREAKDDVGGGETHELEQTIETLRRDLDDARARRDELETTHEDAKAALAAAQAEMDLHAQALSQLREEAQRGAVDAASVGLNEHEARVAELQEALNYERERVRAMETAQEADALNIADLTARVQEAEAASAALGAALEAEQQQLSALVARLAAGKPDEDIASECGDPAVDAVWAAVQSLLVQRANEATEELDRYRRGVAILSQIARENKDMDGDDDAVSVESVVESVRRRIQQLVDELARARADYERALAAHQSALVGEKETAESRLRELEATATQLQQENATLERQLEELAAAQATAVQHEGAGSSEQESDELRKKLSDVESEFERYRTRSHAALKKVEKRAELLNAMKKENEVLVKDMEEMKRQLEAAVEQEEQATLRLEEATRALLQREEDFAQRSEGVTKALEDVEQKCASLETLNGELQTQHSELEARIEALQAEKEELAQSKSALHEQALAAKEADLEESRTLLQEARAARAQLEERVAEMETSLAERSERVEALAAENAELEAKIDGAAAHASEETAQLQQARDELLAQIAQLEGSVTQKEKQIVQLEAANAAHAEAMLAAQEQQAVAAAAASAEDAAVSLQRDANADADADADAELQEQLRTSVAAVETLTQRIAEVELAKTAAEQEAERLRVALAALQESHAAKEAQIVRLLDEIEMMSKRQLDDQRALAELKDRLSESEQRRPAATADVDALHETIQALRQRLVALEASSGEPVSDHEKRNGHATAPPRAPTEDGDVSELHASRMGKREQQLQEAATAKRAKIVAEYVQKSSDVIRELQRGLEEYSSVFRDACALRDDLGAQEETEEEPVANGAVEAKEEDAAAAALAVETEAKPSSPVEYEEYLTLKSGVVVKAGATFSLPVYCEKPGWRVEWKFAVKEDGADVGYALSVETADASTRQSVVAPARVNESSGVVDAASCGAAARDATTAVLRFEWDNTFSWLNEKTLDYHVSVLEPLSDEKKALRARARALHARVGRVDEQLALLDAERQCRATLAQALVHFEQCEAEKETHLTRFTDRAAAIKQAKSQLQVQMEDLQARLGAIVRELDEMETQESAVLHAWQALQAEHEDVDMTMRLSANSRLDELGESLRGRRVAMEDELAAVQREQSVEMNK